ncbi:MAG: NUDIX domain-containing protein [Archangium sp.]|nr:NUDIX domain-containing protein [Archangium sp.]
MADAAIVVIENERGDVLGVSRPGLPDDVGLPGGSIDDGETPEAAAIREVREETSLEVSVRLLFSEPYHGHLVHVFVATSWTGTPRSTPEGEVKWTTWAEVSRGRYGDFNSRICEQIPRVSR